MQQELRLKQKASLFQKAWFRWLWLILFPPLGVFLLWKQKVYSVTKRTIVSAIAMMYFIFPIIIGMTSSSPLYYNEDEFIEDFTKEVKELNLPFTLEDMRENDDTISYKLDEDITLIENVDENGQIHELIMIGQGDGSDIILAMGALIGSVNTDMENNEIGDVLMELRLFDENFKYEMNESTVEKNFIRYNLKYDQSVGVIFSISRVN